MLIVIVLPVRKRPIQSHLLQPTSRTNPFQSCYAPHITTHTCVTCAAADVVVVAVVVVTDTADTDTADRRHRRQIAERAQGADRLLSRTLRAPLTDPFCLNE